LTLIHGRIRQPFNISSVFERTDFTLLLYFRFRLIRYLFLLLSFTAPLAYSQSIWMTPNKGQWDDRILYNVDLNHGKLYIENKGLTFFLTNALVHNHTEKEDDHNGIQYHVIKQNFIGSNWTGNSSVSDSSKAYKNYIIGNNPTKWKSNIFDYENVRMKEFYQGIDLIYSGKDGRLSYNFEISPNSEINQIEFNLEGADEYFIDPNGLLHIKHRFGEIIQTAPVAWAIDENGLREKVEVAFKNRNEKISFFFPNGYDNSKTIFIDPSLTFSTFTGSTADNWGFTATPDINGNLFGGGIVFGTGYPLSTGAYDVSFNSGTGTFPMDVGITKYNASGTNVLYSTYIGGSGNETPHSIVCAPNGELYVYGVTSSINFPMSGSPYDNSHNGGPSELENSLEFNGADIYVARLFPDHFLRNKYSKEGNSNLNLV
jgi:hypothetical protein